MEIPCSAPGGALEKNGSFNPDTQTNFLTGEKTLQSQLSALLHPIHDFIVAALCSTF